MTKEKDESISKKPNIVTKKWSFLDTSKRILDEEKSLTSSIEKVTPQNKAIDSSDNMDEAEPDVNQFFRPGKS